MCFYDVEDCLRKLSRQESDAEKKAKLIWCADVAGQLADMVYHFLDYHEMIRQAIGTEKLQEIIESDKYRGGKK